MTTKEIPSMKDEALAEELCTLLHGIGGHVIPNEDMELAIYSIGGVCVPEHLIPDCRHYFFKLETVSNAERMFCGNKSLSAIYLTGRADAHLYATISRDAILEIVKRYQFYEKPEEPWLAEKLTDELYGALKEAQS